MGRLSAPRPCGQASNLTDRSGVGGTGVGYFPSPSTLVLVHLLASLQNFVNFALGSGHSDERFAACESRESSQDLQKPVPSRFTNVGHPLTQLA